MKRKRKPDKPMKLVRVDARTVIEVDASKPDAEAVRDYLERLTGSRESSYSFGWKRTKT